MALAQPQSDIAMLWEEALNDYSETAKVDIRRELSSQRSITSIMMDQQHQLESFKGFRHDKGKLDKLRTMISSNADIIQGVAKHVADAASAAFPPSSAILTAFTFVMNASKHVSDDYDMIEGFFGIMQSFLRRLSLLEGKIPPQKAFQEFLINVFSSLLKLSGLARAYCAKGRFLKWAKALVDGKDPDLNAAYGKLNENLQRLESATIIQTLRTTIEISEQTKAVDQNVKSLQGSLDRNTALTAQTLETSEQTLMVAVQTNTGMQELLINSRDSSSTNSEMLRRQDEIVKSIAKLHSKDKTDKQRNLKSGASKPANFDRLKEDYLICPAEGGITEKLTDMKLSYVPRLFDWVEDDATFSSIVDNESPLLWVSAGAGMGKSTLSFKMLEVLERKFVYDSSACVAWFSFDEDHPEMRSVLNMFSYCATRAAEKDDRYCSEILTALRRDDDELNLDRAWGHLIEPMFTRESGRRLVLILDGIDETTDEDFPKLVNFMSKIKTQDLAVQVIFTSDPDKKEDLASLEAKCITLDRERITHDMRIFARSKMKTLSRLRKLKSTLKKTIVRKVLRKADSFLYIEHTLRKFSTLGREAPILKELDNLAENTTAVYYTLLEECQKGRTAEDQDLLRNLLAWLAYTKGKLTVAEANMLVQIINKDNSISIEEELDGRLSRLLRISGDRGDNAQDDASDNENKDEPSSDDDQETVANAEGAYHFLSFQERSLKAYFRQAILDHPNALRCTPTEAQVIIFRTCSTILTMPKKDLKPPGLRLVEYAAEFYLDHLMTIHPENETVSEEQVKTVTESIFSIYTNKNDSLKPLEERARWGSQVLGKSDLPDEKVLAALSDWAKRALRLPPNKLTYGTLDWFRPLAHEPRRVFISLSRAHITNWFSSFNSNEAYNAFWGAHSALREGRNLPELKQNPNLQGYFEEYMKEEKITERSFDVVANCFWDIVKTSSSYKGIGLAMQIDRDLYEPAVKQLNIGLDDNTIDDLERYQLLSSVGDTLLRLGADETEEEKRNGFLERSHKSLEEANEMYRKMNEANRVNVRISSFASRNLYRTAHVAALQNNFDIAISRIKEAVDLKFSFAPRTLIAVIEALKKAGKLSIILDVLKLVPKGDMVWYLFNEETEPSQEAAKRLDQGQYLLDLYETARKTIETWPYGSGHYKSNVMMQAAAFAFQALGKSELAKDLLREVINISTVQDWRVAEGCNRLAEILLEDFRLSKNPLVKKKALDETRQLLDKLKEVIPEDFNPAESMLTVTISLMLGRLGPALELSDRLHAAFKNCIENLQDDTGANDMDALRRLSRVLTCVPGFERDASISYTAQLYIVDEEVHRKETEQQNGTSQKDEEPPSGTEQKDAVNGVPVAEIAHVEHDGPQAPPSIDSLVNGPPATEGQQNLTVPLSTVIPNSLLPGIVPNGSPNGDITATVKDATVTPTVKEIDEGNPELYSFYCNYCTKTVGKWSEGGAYYCVYCIDCDICEECFQKKIAREKGELEPDWRVLCPKGHKHVKGPVEGWRGVKDGKMRIGEEEILFRTWLVQLEANWVKYWDTYWTDKTVEA